MKELRNYLAAIAAVIVLGLGINLGLGTSDKFSLAQAATYRKDVSFGFEYETVAASQTAQVMGVTGAAGDYLDHCVIVVATAATAATTILDNSTSVVAFANSPGGGIGVYNVDVKARSVSGAWKVTTGAGASVVCVGRFTN